MMGRVALLWINQKVSSRNDYSIHGSSSLGWRAPCVVYLRHFSYRVSPRLPKDLVVRLSR